MRYSKPSLILSILISLCMHMDTISGQSNTVAGGKDASGAGGSVSYTIGQIDYINYTGVTGSINEGVQQPIEIYSVGIEKSEIGPFIQLYPNPTNHFILLDIESCDMKEMSYTICEIGGAQLISLPITQLKTQISLEEFSDGIYILKIYNHHLETRSFKIIKKT